jgi:diamine N-acetyltransferase
MIDSGQRDRQGRRISLHEIGDDRRAVADVMPRDYQRRFVFPSAARYVLLSVLEGDCRSLGIRADDTVVGHVMWAVDDDGSRWIGGLILDRAHQGTGIGRAATMALSPGCPTILSARSSDSRTIPTTQRRLRCTRRWASIRPATARTTRSSWSVSRRAVRRSRRGDRPPRSGGVGGGVQVAGRRRHPGEVPTTWG